MNEKKNLMTELVEQIINADNEAIKKGIQANAVILNKDYDYVKGFGVLLEGLPSYVKPMICGKHIFIGVLPKDYTFALTEIDEKKYQSDLDAYKSRCAMLEEKLAKIGGVLNGHRD